MCSFVMCSFAKWLYLLHKLNHWTHSLNLFIIRKLYVFISLTIEPFYNIFFLKIINLNKAEVHSLKNCIFWELFHNRNFKKNCLSKKHIHFLKSCIFSEIQPLNLFIIEKLHLFKRFTIEPFHNRLTNLYIVTSSLSSPLLFNFIVFVKLRTINNVILKIYFLSVILTHPEFYSFVFI